GAMADARVRVRPGRRESHTSAAIDRDVAIDLAEAPGADGRAGVIRSRQTDQTVAADIDGTGDIAARVVADPRGRVRIARRQRDALAADDLDVAVDAPRGPGADGGRAVIAGGKCDRRRVDIDVSRDLGGKIRRLDADARRAAIGRKTEGIGSDVDRAADVG